jgi:protein-S-isoprenylcysteine O-methyltransferase Ste14
MEVWKHILLFFSVLGYGTLHSVLAADEVKRFLFAGMPSLKRSYRFMYTVIAIVTLIPIVVVYAQLDETVLIASKILQFLGATCVVAGMILLLVAFKSYDLKIFMGLDFSEESDTREPLVITGMYHYVRHPLYFALIVLFLGFAMLVPDARTFLLVGAMLIYIVVGSTLEERKLTQRYGEAYQAYCRKTKRWIPFVI